MQRKNQRSGSKIGSGFYFNFKRNHNVLNSKSPCINKNKSELKIEPPPPTVLEWQTLYFSSCKNCKVKVKLPWVGSRERKKKTFFVPFILSKGNFFNVCVLSQCIVYWIQFQNIHALIYQKTLLHTLFACF